MFWSLIHKGCYNHHFRWCFGGPKICLHYVVLFDQHDLRKGQIPRPVFLDGTSNAVDVVGSGFLSPATLRQLNTARRLPVYAARFTAFHSPFGVVFIVRSHYCFAIGLGEYLALPGGSR